PRAAALHRAARQRARRRRDSEGGGANARDHAGGVAQPLRGLRAAHAARRLARHAYGAPQGLSDPRVEHRRVVRLAGEGRRDSFEDSVAVERALDIRVNDRPLAVTLRTPGDDEELALGFLAGGGLVRGTRDVSAIQRVPPTRAAGAGAGGDTLTPGVVVDWTKLERHFAATAACGLCGRAHLESLRAGLRPIAAGPPLAAAALADLPARLREEQAAFEATGGLHAAAFLEP